MTANARMRDSACPKFRTMRNQQSKHDVHGCTIAVAQSRCTMQRPKRPQFDTPAPPHFRPLNERGIIFGAAGARTRNLRVRQGCWRFSRDSAVLEGLIRARADGVASPPVVARIFAGDSISPLTRNGRGCTKLNARRLCTDAPKQQLIQFFIQRVDKLQQYIAKSV